MATPDFTLHPQPRDRNGARVRFDCHECGHSEVFTGLQYADLAHVLGSDHYWGECPVVRWRGEQPPAIVAHRVKLAKRHRVA